MRPASRNLFIKKDTRERVAPIISRKGLLAGVNNERLKLSIFAKVRKEKEKSGEALFAGIK
jgi:hypothetical protein